MNIGHNSPTNSNKILFGREHEVEQLDRILSGSYQDEGGTSTTSLVAVRGLAGSGKSTFVESYPWEEQGWLFCSGKYEAHQTAEPYSGLIEALDRLIEHWFLDETEQKESRQDDDDNRDQQMLREYQQLLLQNCEVLSNVLPEAGRVAGIEEEARGGVSSCLEGADLSTLDDVTAALHSFVSFLCSKKPSVLFLDDIQWADPASLHVIQAFASKEKIQDLLLVVSYREEEMDESHKVGAFLEKTEANGARVLSIHINDLDVENLNSLVAHLVGREPPDTLPLTNVIHTKTGGNPFFVLQFLKLLQNEGFLTYSCATMRWEWGNVGEIHTLASISDNVAEVVAVTIDGLPLETQLVLQAAACLGRKNVPVDLLRKFFDSPCVDDRSSTLAFDQALLKLRRDGVEQALYSAVANGIFIVDAVSGRHNWSHDKLLQVSYALIHPPVRYAWHLRIGQLLWETSKTASGEDWMVFAAADQLNRFYTLRGSDSASTVDIARLNLEAAKMALKKCALFPAMDMLRSGAHHLERTTAQWSEHYKLCIEIYSHLGEIGVLIGQHEEVMDAVREVEENAQCVDDKFRAQCAMLHSITSENNRDYELGVEKALEILKMYGEKIPRKVRPGQLFYEKKRLKAKLPGGRLEGLLEIPKMIDRRAFKVTKLLLQHLSRYAALSPKYRGLLPLTTLRALNIACQTGLSEMTAYAVCNYAIDLKLAEDYQEALTYGRFAIELVDKFPQRLGSSHCTVKFFAITGIFDAVLPFNASLDSLLEAHRIGLAVGDTEKSVLAVVSYSWSYLSVGLPIGPLQTDLISYGNEAETLKVPYSIRVLFKIYRQTILNLQSEGCQNPCILDGDAMYQDEELKKVAGSGAKMTLREINTFRLMLACVYNDWDTAKGMVHSLEEYLKFDIVAARGHFRTTYLGLAAFALHRVTGNKRYEVLGEKVLKYFKKEASLGSVNAFPVITMLEAEACPSKSRFEIAIKTCARLGLSHHEAYMCERAGEYFLTLNDAGWARIYMDRSVSLYKDWGAFGKVKAITIDQVHILTPATPETHNTPLKGRQRFSTHDTRLFNSITG